MTWTLQSATTWTGGPVAAVGAGQVLQDGWIDLFGNSASINASNQLVMAGVDYASPLIRPQSENAQDVLVDAQIVSRTASDKAGIVLRRGVDLPSDYYLFFLDPGPTGPFAVSWRKYEQELQSWSFIHNFECVANNFTGGDTYRLVVSVQGTAITVASVHLRNTTTGVDAIGTTGADVDSITYEGWTDTPAAVLQVPGYIGLVSGLASNDLFGPVSIYTDLAAIPDYPASRGNN